MIALVVYEYAITLGAEIRLFWGKKFTAASALFHLNRQITLATCWFQLVWSFYGIRTLEVRNKLHDGLFGDADLFRRGIQCFHRAPSATIHILICSTDA